VSQWSLTQINATGGKRPYVRRSHLSGFPRGEVPFPQGRAWQLMGVRSSPKPAPFFVPPAQERLTTRPDVSERAVGVFRASWRPCGW
jgi:hypothetical protein